MKQHVEALTVVSVNPTKRNDIPLLKPKVKMLIFGLNIPITSMFYEELCIALME